MITKFPFNLRYLPSAISAVVALVCASRVHAFTLTAADVIGYVQPATPSEPVDETARLQFFIDLANNQSAVGPDANSYFPVLGPNVPSTLPSPATFATKITTSSLPITISNPYTYLMAKFGPDAVYYYLGGQTGTLESLFVPPDLGTNGNGLSHISLFNQTGTGPGTSVPDGGATAVLLGFAVSGLVLLRRRVARQ